MKKKKPKESKPKKVLDKCATLLKSTKEKLKQYASTVSKQESTISISKIKTSTVKSTKIEKKTTKKCTTLKKQWKKSKRNLYERVKGSKKEEKISFDIYVNCLTDKHKLTINVMTVKVENSKKTIDTIQKNH